MMDYLVHRLWLIYEWCIFPWEANVDMTKTAICKAVLLFGIGLGDGASSLAYNTDFFKVKAPEHLISAALQEAWPNTILI
ncbi:hypothetical protein Taro_024416 [Colocasia esculenta]|uniref:Uncharacterized protein n=1 Tax=Colocasia esculenta TaxID=4460 RepID=A0A843V0A2_COLES|nr:hypothetical protein [Colocasia esculenta]